jgi:hypothetical protein
MNEAVKVLGCDRSRNWLFNLLRENHVLDGKNNPNLLLKAQGYFTQRETSFDVNGHKRVYLQTLVTHKGIHFIKGLMYGAGKKTESIRSGDHSAKHHRPAQERTDTSA